MAMKLYRLLKHYSLALACLCALAPGSPSQEEGATVQATGTAPAAASEAIEDGTPSSSLFSSLKVHGSLNTTYSFRDFDGIDDQDFYAFFSLRLDNIIKDRLDGAFSMFWHEDLNGGSPLRGYDYDPFLDLDQASSTRFRFYTGYLDLKQLGFEDSSLRVGRQFIEEIDYAHFDGLTYRFSPMDPLEITLFGGRPVTFFSGTSGDAIYGTNIDYRFSEQTRAALRYYRYDSDPFQDDLAALELWHRFTPNIQGHLEFSLLDVEPYILQNDYAFFIEQADLDINLQLVRLFESIADHTINFNPYFPLMYEREPFTYGSVFMTKGITEWMSLTGGVDARFTDSINDLRREFTNRDFVRGQGGVEFYPVKGLTLSLTGEFWSVDPDDEFTGITGEVEYKPNKKWTLTAGAEYGEYVQEYRDEFFFFALNQDRIFRISPDVITYYARVKWQPTSRLFTQFAFEWENSDPDDPAWEDDQWGDDDWYGIRLQAGVNF